MTQTLTFQSEPDLLSPINEEIFCRDYREHRPLHIGRADHGYFANVVSTKKLETVFSTAALYYPDVQLTQTGCDIQASDYANAESLIDPARFFARYAQGATVIVSGSDRLFPQVAALCRQASRRFGGACRANLYLSPPGHQGFAPHYDTHDVLVLQIAGSKTFKLYENNISLPFPEDGFQPDGFAPGAMTEEVVLSAGDTFYIPRGFTHDACASAEAESPSLHLTLGLYPPMLRDVLHRLVDELAETQVDLRRSIKSADWQFDGVTDELANSLQQCLTNNQLHQLLPQVMREFRDDVALAGLSIASQATTVFTQAPAAEPAYGSRLLLHKHRYLSHETLDDTLYCRTFGQVLEFSSPHRQRVQSWLSSGDLAVSHFTGSAEAPLVGGDDVLKSLLASGLGYLQ